MVWHTKTFANLFSLNTTVQHLHEHVVSFSYAILTQQYAWCIRNFSTDAQLSVTFWLFWSNRSLNSFKLIVYYFCLFDSIVVCTRHYSILWHHHHRRYYIISAPQFQLWKQWRHVISSWTSDDDAGILGGSLIIDRGWRWWYWAAYR